MPTTNVLEEAAEPPDSLCESNESLNAEFFQLLSKLKQKVTAGQSNLSQQNWGDWKWQMAKRLRKIDDLVELLNLSPLQAKRYEHLIQQFHFAVTPYYLSLIDWKDPNCPILKQSIPSLEETDVNIVGEMDPLDEEEDMPVQGLVHRYPDRVLAVITTTCAMYCRHCVRKRAWWEGEEVRNQRELSAMVDYVRRTPAVREVVISGGDPLTVKVELLDWFLGELSKIEHLDIVRIGTRVPVVLPMRIDDEMVSMLARHRPLWINTQFNHKREITPESTEACDRLLRAGIPVSNQSVLLKGINDTPETMLELCHALQKIMVRPYYLFQCDPVVGAEHFRTSIWKGMEIMEKMRGHTGGLSVPTYVVDAPGGGGKIPIQPNYIISASDQEVTLRNYEGKMVKYFNPAPERVVPVQERKRKRTMKVLERAL